jgi:hypothetical protein
MKRTLLPLAALIFLSLACSLSGGAAPTASSPSADSVNTAVAGTLTAAAPPMQELPYGTPTEAPAEATAAPTEPAQPAQPVLAAAFTDNARNLWAWREDGAALQLTSSGDVEQVWLAPDGQKVAFSRSTDFQHYTLWLIGTGGAGELQLMSTDEIQSSNSDPSAVGGMVYQAAWTPDSRSLLASTRPLYEGPGLALNYDLWSIAADSGAKHLILEPGEGGMFFISPDGQQLALSRPTGMDLINLDGSNRRSQVLTYASMITYSEYLYHPMPVWAPDSSYLRVIIPVEDPLASPLPPASLFRIPTDGSQAVPEGTIPLAAFTEAQYAPDLQHIAYLTALGQSKRELRIAAYNGETERVIASGEVGFLRWAPDSSGFAYYSGLPTDALLGDLSGTVSDLADVKPVFSVRWIDSTRLFFMTRTDTHWQVRLGDAGGGSSLLAELPFDINGFNPQLESGK